MPSQGEISEKINEVEEWLELAGEEKVDDYRQEVEDGPDLRGVVARHGSHQLVVVGAADRQYFTVARGYNVVEGLASQYAAQEVLGTLDSMPDDGESIELDIEPEDEHWDRAIAEVEKRLDDASMDVKGKMHFKCVQFLSNPDAAYRLHTDDENGVYGFEVTKNEWVFDDGYGPGDLADAIQAVISIGMPAEAFLQRAYGIDLQVIEVGTGAEVTLEEESDEGRAFY